MVQNIEESVPHNIEIQLFLAIFSTIFIFLGFLLNIPEESSLFTNTIQPMLFLYKINLYKSIISNLVLSFILFCGAVIIFYKHYNQRTAIKGYRACIYLGLYYWFCLFTNILYLIDIKYLKLASAEIIALNFLVFAIGYAVLIVYMLFKVYPGPHFEGTSIYAQILWIVCYMGFWAVWVNIITPAPDSIISPFNYLWTPYVVMMLLTMGSTILVKKITPQFIKIT